MAVSSVSKRLAGLQTFLTHAAANAVVRTSSIMQQVLVHAEPASFKLG